MYTIIRFYFQDRPRRTIKRGLTLEEAQLHCRNPESSSSTCTSPVGRRRTRQLGPWFDGFQEAI